MSNAPDAPDALGEPDPAPNATNPRLLTRRFNDFMRFVLDQREARGVRGIASERNRFANHLEHAAFAEKPLDAITRGDIETWLAEMSEKVASDTRGDRKIAPDTIRRALSLLSRVFFVAGPEQLGLIDNNPFHGLHVTKLLGPDEDDDDDLTYLTYEEQQALASCADISEPDRLAILFAIGTGLTQSTALREVPARPTTVFDENAARAARHGAYHEAVAWAVALAELQDDDPAKIARIVAEGALLPLSDFTRFELAVTMRLAEALGEELDAQEPGRWRCERGVIVAKRDELFAFVRLDGVAIRIFYNQEVLPSGVVYAGARHYLGNEGGLRPDVVVTFDKPGEPRNAVVVECKHSTNPGYLLEGFHEAVLYRTEYAAHLRGRLKAILVVSSPIAGLSRPDDDVVAADWSTWPPRMVVEELVSYARGDK